MDSEYTERRPSSDSMDRPARHAGRFYPSQEGILRKELSQFFKQSHHHHLSGLRAIIVPHAGYGFSGAIAAEGYAQIEKTQVYQRIFILASSHRMSFPGASIYNQGDFISPLGRVKVDRELTKLLINKHKIFQFDAKAHEDEHSLEVQLPFLQYYLKQIPPIIPIVIGTQSADDCQEISEALQPYFCKENLFIISSDFSHYPTYNDAISVDGNTADAILLNDSRILLETIRKNSSLKIQGLATTLCGWTSVLTLLYLSEQQPNMAFHKLKYMNSGDVAYGDRERVVGYHAIALTETKEMEPSFRMSTEAEETLLGMARAALENHVLNKPMPSLTAEGIPQELLREAGAFVSLHNGRHLRGCIGRFEAREALWHVVEKMAIAAATDSRFKPVEPSELPDINIEISILTPLEAIQSPADIQIGRHGIYLRHNMASGTLLPQVAVQYHWTAEEFLSYCARDKAGIGWEGWKNAELFRFEALILRERKRLP